VKRKYLCIQLYYYCWECPLVKVWSLGLVSKHWNTVYNQFCYMFACCHFYFRLQLPLIIIHITCILISLRRTSAPIHLTSVLGVLGTQETSCILIAGLLERDIFDLYLPEFDKPWVIHLRETCCCSTNLCTWRPNTVYKNRSVSRHQAIFWRRCRGGKCWKVSPLDSAIISFCLLFLFSLVRLNGKQQKN
jgi:hypothetical protein